MSFFKKSLEGIFRKKNKGESKEGEVSIKEVQIVDSAFLKPYFVDTDSKRGERDKEFKLKLMLEKVNPQEGIEVVEDVASLKEGDFIEIDKSGVYRLRKILDVSFSDKEEYVEKLEKENPEIKNIELLEALLKDLENQMRQAVSEYHSVKSSFISPNDPEYQKYRDKKEEMKKEIMENIDKIGEEKQVVLYLIYKNRMKENKGEDSFEEKNRV